jgi:hypothetical protein
MVRRLLVAFVLACVGCQLLLGIETDVPIADGGVSEGSSPSDANAPDASVAVDATGDAPREAAQSVDASPEAASIDAPSILDAAAPTPIVLAAEAGSPSAIVVDSTNVYWTNGSFSIMMCPVGGCMTPTPLIRDDAVPQFLAIDSQYIYWTDLFMASGSAKECTLANHCLSGPTALGGGLLSTPAGIAVQAGNVYWTDSQSKTVNMCPSTGCTQPTTLAAQQPAVSAIAVDATHLYWTTQPPSTTSSNPPWGTIMRCDLTDGGCSNPTPFAVSPHPSALSVNATNVVWLDTGTPFAGGWVMTCPVTGCPDGGQLDGGPLDFTILASDQRTPSGIATDETYAYWTNPFDGTVRKCAVSLDGGPSQVLADAQAGPSGIAVDDTSVYWCNYNSGTVMKLAK